MIVIEIHNEKMFFNASGILSIARQYFLVFTLFSLSVATIKEYIQKCVLIRTYAIYL